MKITPNKDIIDMSGIDIPENRLTVDECSLMYGEVVSYEIKNWMTGEWYRTTHKITGQFLTQMEQGTIRRVVKVA